MENIELSPGLPDICKSNGETIDEDGELIECRCDECDYFLLCFPEYKKGVHLYDEEDL